MDLIQWHSELAIHNPERKWVQVHRDGDAIGFGPPVDKRTRKGTWVMTERSMTIIVRDNVFQWGGDISLPDKKHAFIRAVRMISDPNYKVKK